MQQSLSKQWSSSTLVDGMNAVAGQHAFLHSKSDSELEAELAVPRLVCLHPFA